MADNFTSASLSSRLAKNSSNYGKMKKQASVSWFLPEKKQPTVSE